MTISLKQKELLVSLGVIGVGLFFLFQAGLIENLENDEVGPELVPTILSWMLIVLVGLSSAYWMLLSRHDESERLSFSLSALFWIVAITVLGLVYFVLFQAVGYLLSTIAILAVTLVALGIRKPLKVLFLSVFGGVAFFIVFIRLMAVYDPPGSLIDISTFLAF